MFSDVWVMDYSIHFLHDFLTPSTMQVDGSGAVRKHTLVLIAIGMLQLKNYKLKRFSYY